MAERGTSSGVDYLVATLPPSPSHRRFALAVLVVTLVAMAGVIPFAKIPLARLDSFIPTILAITFVTDLVTAVLLFGQFSATGSRALLALATGYLYSSLIVIPHALTFPGAFAPSGVLGAGPQTTAWLNVSWRFGLALALVTYGLLKVGKQRRPSSEPPRRIAICQRVIFVLLLVSALVVAFTAGEPFMPRLILTDPPRVSALGSSLNAIIALTDVVTLLLLFSIRQKSILDVWLIVAVSGLICESGIIALFIMARFSFGFYAIRVISLLVSKVVLISLLSETMWLYARLLVANRHLQSARASKLASAEAAVAAVAHEIRQPLTSMIALADAGRLILDSPSPDLADAKALFGKIKTDAFRANEVFASVLSLYREGHEDFDEVDVNALVLETIRLMRNELVEHGIAVVTSLAPDLPPLMGSHRQLQEVLLNLIQNAIEAMTATTSRSRTISIATQPLDDSDSVLISVEDTGPGIDPKKLPSIFDPFVTTRVGGTGLGLGICKLVINRHGGRLSATAGAAGGARLEITLPTRMAESSPTAAVEDREVADTNWHSGRSLIFYGDN